MTTHINQAMLCSALGVIAVVTYDHNILMFRLEDFELEKQVRKTHFMNMVMKYLQKRYREIFGESLQMYIQLMNGVEKVHGLNLRYMDSDVIYSHLQKFKTTWSLDGIVCHLACIITLPHGMIT